MTPEEKFNKGVWYVLKKIKERSLYTKKGESIKYQVNFYGYHDPTAPSPENEVEILEILQERGVIQIRNKEDVKASEYISSEAQIFYLGILQPELDKFCKKWEEIDENPWLSEETKIVQKEKLFEKQRKEAEIRVKEIRKHFEKLNERQKELKESEERIYSRIRKELDIPIQYFKSHEEIIKKISEQLAPLKDALERVGRAQQTVKISLTPALQRLAPSLKQLEEQIKNFNELYKAPDYSLSEAIILD
jgi:chromosome segregation ATPase